MQARRGIKELFYRTIGILYKYAEEVTVLDYPSSHNRRSIDIIAKIRGRPVLVKVIDDLAGLPRTEIDELLGTSRTLGTPPLIVASYWGGEELSDFIAYTISDAYAVTPDTLEGILSGRGNIYVRTAKDGLHVSISGEKLRGARMEAGLSMGKVAEYVGVSRKTIYEYERENLEPNIEKGRRLLELFGESILDPIDIFTSPKPREAKKLNVDNEAERRIITEIKRMGGEAFHLKRASMDVVANLDERILFVVEHRKKSAEALYSKIENTGKASSIMEGKAYYVYEEEKIDRSEAEGLGLEPVRYSRIRDLLRELCSDRK